MFMWKLRLNRLPSRVNLDRRGLDLHSILCPTCDSDVETVNHLFFSCELALDLWALVARWWEIDISICSSISDWDRWFGSLTLKHNTMLCLEVVFCTMCWEIWNFRNKLLFDRSKPIKAAL